MKKLIVFLLLSFKIVYCASYDRLERAFYYPHTPKRPCHKSLSDESLSGFSNAYRKRIGDQYLKQMIEDQKKETKEKKIKTARPQVIEKKDTTFLPHLLKISSQMNQSTNQKFPLLPLRTAPSFSPLRTPRKAAELSELLVIQSLLPEIIQQPKLNYLEIIPKR